MTLKTVRVVVGASLLALVLGGCSASGSGDVEREGAAWVPTASLVDRAMVLARAQSVVGVGEIGEASVLVEQARANLKKVKSVEVVQRLADPKADVKVSAVRATRSGVAVDASVDGVDVTAVSVDGQQGWVRGPAKFWRGQGLDADVAKASAGQWVESKSVAVPVLATVLKDVAAVLVFPTESAVLTDARVDGKSAVFTVSVEGGLVTLVRHKKFGVVPVKFVRDGEPDPVVELSFDGVEVSKPSKPVKMYDVAYEVFRDDEDLVGDVPEVEGSTME